MLVNPFIIENGETLHSTSLNFNKTKILNSRNTFLATKYMCRNSKVFHVRKIGEKYDNTSPHAIGQHP